MSVRMTFVVFLLFTASAFGQNETGIQKAIQSIDPNTIKATMSFLADDLLEGRQPGTRGFALASKYVESRFMSLGLKPGNNNKDYIQRVPLGKGVVNSQESAFILSDGTNSDNWTYGKEFILAPYQTQDQSEAAASLVFAGFGVYAPELGYDDYKEIEVKGKIVVIVDQAPEAFGNNERAYFSSPAVKYQEAYKRGAVGVATLVMNNRSSWHETVDRSTHGSFKWLDEKNHPVNVFEGLKAIAILNPLYKEKLFSRSGKDFQEVYDKLKKGKPQSFPLNISARIKVVTQRSYVESSNLIGIIPGSDPALKDEYVVYVAHLDHLGIGAPVNGDSLYNGAHDNASGVAILLEVGRAFRSLPVPPRRSIVIAVVTGEEYGLLGSDYFANNPTLKGTIVANLALDMPFFFHPVLDIVPYGAQHSSLSRQVAEAAKILHLKVSPDPFPDQVVFIRSDHFSFIKKGIPALFIKSGFMTSKSDTVNRARSDVEWRTTTYHKPQDDMSQAFDYQAAATHVKVNFLIGLFTANAQTPPRWNKGDFFGGKFGKK